MKISKLYLRSFGFTLALLYSICPVLATDFKVLPGHVPKAVSHLSPMGELPATNQLRLAIGLPLRNGVELEAFLKQLYDPASPGFRQYLSPEEFTARFGPTAQDYEAVENFARTNGLTITNTFDNRLVLDVTGPASAIEKAFHVKLQKYHHPTEGRDFFSPDTEPTVDVSLPVADIQGLSDFSRPRPKFARKNPADGKPKTGSAPNGAGTYFGNDFRNAYAPGVTLTGAGQFIGLFEADGFYAADISAYATAAGNGRTNISIQTVLIDSFSGKPTKGSDSGNPEVSLDIEMAMAMAPGLTKIISFEGNPNNYIPNDILNSMLSSSATVKILSCSWGWSEGPTATTDMIFTNMAAVGQSFFNASGDSCAFTAGAGSTNGVDNPSIPNAPSSNPYTTQVGGTTLTMNGTGAAYSSETVWNWGIELGSSYNGVGSSGGVSSYYSIPAWQTSVSDLTAVGGSTSYRNIPDVALTADNVYVNCSNGKVEDIGGTSCAAPLWAGFTALANQQAVTNGKPVVGFINPALYGIAAGANYNACFHDVTTGNNTWSQSPNLFYAVVGYDLCTGLGTPNGTSLINALAGAQGLGVSPLSGAANGLAGGPFTITSGNFLLTNLSTASLNWSVLDSAPWLAISVTNGTLAASGSTTLVCSLTAAANNLPAGTYTTSLTFSNLTTQTAQSVSFTLQVNQPLMVSPTNGFSVGGPVGGPFNATSENFSLINQSGNSLAWGIVNPAPWLNVSPSSGTLGAGAQTTVTVSLTAAADNLAAGSYTNNLLVTNFAGTAASLPFTLNPGQSIVSNGGFETGSFSGWVLNATNKYNYVTDTSGFVHSGTYGVALGQSGSVGYLYQTIATSPGQNYVLSLWFDNPANSSGATPNQFLVQWNGTAVFNQTNIPFTAWTNLQFVVTATGSSTVLQFGFEDTPYYLGLDDVTVAPVSSPVFKTAQLGTSAFNLAWSAVSGLSYQVQYNTNLSQTNWINLGGPQVATGGTLTFSDTNAFNASPLRFYRIIVLP